MAYCSKQHKMLCIVMTVLWVSERGDAYEKTEEDTCQRSVM